jgi:hypothetical protein
MRLRIKHLYDVMKEANDSRTLDTVFKVEQAMINFVNAVVPILPAIIEFKRTYVNLKEARQYLAGAITARDEEAVTGARNIIVIRETEYKAACDHLAGMLDEIR